MNDKDNINSEKEIAYYSALVDAWVNTRMERDRSLLSLATAGVGLLITLLTTVGITSNVMYLFYGLGFVCFMITIIAAVMIFGWNADFIGELTKDENKRNYKEIDRLDGLLKKCDVTIMAAFISGLVVSILLAVTYALNKL